jgi:transposase
MEATNIIESKSERAPVETRVTVLLGLDVHATQVTVSRQRDGRLPQPSQQMSEVEVLRLVQAAVASGARVYSCYEAGPCGYGLHRALTALGATNYVVAPQRWDERGRRVKTDQRDARELCNQLERYVRGNTDAFAVVRVPTPEQEQRRALCRQRGTLLKERQRCEVHGHGLMLAQGIRAVPGWWEPAAWQELAPQLPAWLRDVVGRWQQHAVRFEKELTELTPRLEAWSAGQLVPKGLGELTATLIDHEVVDWTRFPGRRAVSSYTGLCPSEYSSNQRRRQGAVNKHGNPRLRQALVEAVWRLLQWQPDYPPLQKIRAAQSKRLRKRAAVAAARRLAVDLWRLRTARCTAAQLGLRLREP